MHPPAAPRGATGTFLHPRTWSISIRLALWYGFSIMVLLSAFAALTYASFQRSVQQDFDQHLLHELRALLPLVEFGEEGPRFSRFEAMQSVAYQTDGVLGTYVRILDAQGATLYRSPNLERHPRLPVMAPSDPIVAVTAQVWEDGPIRSHYHPLLSADGQHLGWLEVSGFEWALNQELDRLIQTFTIGILVSFALALMGGFLLARRALRPVASITRVANEIRASSLDRRVPINEGVQDELAELGQTINGLLERIEESFHRERRFSANAAHELVTPLAAVRGELELALRGGDISDDLAPRLVAALGDIDRMNGIIRSLLQLSSAERLQRARFSSLDIHEVLLEHLGRFEDRATVEQKTISMSPASGCRVRATREGLGKIIDNLLDNALKYTDVGGQISVTLVCEPGSAKLSIADNGIGFNTEDGALLFDRFFRANTGDVKARTGSGLGLAIVEAAVAAFGGSITAASEGPGLGASFTVVLPTEA